jgi:outer membrane lipoprotein-sorting protein
MKLLRTVSTRRLLAGLLGVLVVGLASTAIAIAAAGNGPVPAPASLANAIHTAMQGKPVAGVSADITFTNNLFAGSSIETVDPLLTGATGRLWAGNGRLRLELQSANGDAQLVLDRHSFWIYDPASHTVYEGALPNRQDASSPGNTGGTLPTVAQIQRALDRLGTHAGVSAATATDVGGQPAYSVELTPNSSAGLIGAVRFAFDANQGNPLDFAVFPRGDSNPALELQASNVSYGPVSPSDFQPSPPAGSNVVHVSLPEHQQSGATPTDKGSVSVVGQGLGAVVVAKRAAGSGAGSGSGPAGPLPVKTVTIDGVKGQELPTSLGTVLQFTRDGVGYLLAGSVTPSTIESVAASLP